MADLNTILMQHEQGMRAALSQAKEAERAARGNDAKLDMLRQQNLRMEQDLTKLSGVLANLESVPGPGGKGDRHIQYVEQIPGRRIPYDLTVNIPIGPNVTTVLQASETITQDGPFVAVARYATFQSAYEFTYQDPETNAKSAFKGRSYGRFRPIHSVNDVMDSMAGFVNPPTTGIALPGDGSGIYVSPSNHSAFRTMQLDGTVEFRNQGSAYPRQNSEVPSSFYMQGLNAPFLLSALDFFERGEVLQWLFKPTHPNNPSFGNVQAYAAGGVYPFLDSQYDVHEGILDPLLADVTVDPVSRLPQGVLTIGFHGYRIIQPPGTVSLV